LLLFPEATTGGVEQMNSGTGEQEKKGEINKKDGRTKPSFAIGYAEVYERTQQQKFCLVK
jgi:hypothetical protein